MQKSTAGKLFSASDLVNFAACAHLTHLDLVNLETPLPKTADSEEMVLIQDKGYEHEGRYLEHPGISQELKSALSLFNDVIQRVCARQGIPVLDLRAICDEPSDYSVVSPIEPSSTGGQKIARRMVEIVTQHNFGDHACKVYS